MRLMGMLLPVILGTLSACSTVHVVSQAKLDRAIALSGGSFKKVGGGITIATELKDIGGKTGVCGVWAKSPDLHPWVRETPEMQLLPSGAVFLNGTRLLTNLSYLQEVAPAPNYMGLMANCAVSDQPWQAAYAQMTPEVRIPKQVAYRDIDEGGGGIVIRFEQTGPSA